MRKMKQMPPLEVVEKPELPNGARSTTKMLHMKRSRAHTCSILITDVISLKETHE